MNRPSRARQRGFVVGVDLGASNLRVALASMDGSCGGQSNDVDWAQLCNNPCF